MSDPEYLRGCRIGVQSDIELWSALQKYAVDAVEFAGGELLQWAEADKHSYTHVVANHAQEEHAAWAKGAGKAIVTLLWLWDSLRSGKRLPTDTEPLYNAEVRPTAPDAAGLHVSTTGYQDLSKVVFARMMKTLGLEFHKSMEIRRTDFLIANDVHDRTSKKIEAARQPPYNARIRVVNILWLYDSLRQGRLLPAEAYLDNPPAEMDPYRGGLALHATLQAVADSDSDSPQVCMLTAFGDLREGAATATAERGRAQGDANAGQAGGDDDQLQTSGIKACQRQATYAATGAEELQEGGSQLAQSGPESISMGGHVISASTSATAALFGNRTEAGQQPSAAAPDGATDAAARKQSRPENVAGEGEEEGRHSSPNRLQFAKPLPTLSPQASCPELSQQLERAQNMTACLINQLAPHASLADSLAPAPAPRQKDCTQEPPPSGEASGRRNLDEDEAVAPQPSPKRQKLPGAWQAAGQGDVPAAAPTPEPDRGPVPEPLSGGEQQTMKKASTGRKAPQPRTRRRKQARAKLQLQDENDDAAERKPAKRGKSAPATTPNSAEGGRRLARRAVFAVSGMHSGTREAAAAELRSLGAAVSLDLHGHKWDCRVTHVVLSINWARGAKVLAGMAAGAWLLSESYLAASDAARRLLEEEEYEIAGHPKKTISKGAPTHWRRRKEATGGGAFHGLSVAVYGEFEDGQRPLREEVVSILQAGGASFTSAALAHQLPAHFVVTKASRPATDKKIKLLRDAHVCIVSPAFVIEWLAHPWAALDKHLLFRSKVGPELAAAMAARGSTDAVAAKLVSRLAGAEGEDIEVDIGAEEEASQLY